MQHIAARKIHVEHRTLISHGVLKLLTNVLPIYRRKIVVKTHLKKQREVNLLFVLEN